MRLKKRWAGETPWHRFCLSVPHGPHRSPRCVKQCVQVASFSIRPAPESACRLPKIPVSGQTCRACLPSRCKRIDVFEDTQPELASAREGESRFGELRLDDFRNQLLNRLYGAAAIVALCYAPVLAWRILEVQWHVQLGIHLFFVMLVLSLYPFVKRILLKVKAAIALGSMLALGTMGVLTMGLVGSGYLWLLESMVVAAVLYSLRAAGVVSVYCALLLIAAAAGFTSGRLSVPLDLNAFVTSPSAWIGFFVVVVFVPVSLLYTLANHQAMTEQLMGQIEAQRKQLALMVGHDQLTGLPQNTLAMDRLEVQLASARRTGRRAALLFIDLDGFKSINDRHGHTAGDFVLVAAAHRLRAALRESDTVARVGGDEFVVILGELTAAATAAEVADKVLSEIACVVNWNGHALRVGASVGVALFPDHALTAEGLRQVADTAMYEAKTHGKNRYRFAPPTAKQPLTG